MAKIQKTGSSGAELLADMMRGQLEEKITQMLPLENLREAPDEWNFFRPLPENKLFELIASIEENGLLVPLIVWEQEEDHYIILSGHNRKRALQLLYEKTGDEAYHKAACVLYEADALTKDEARSILIDSNWVSRTLTTTEKARSVYAKYVELGRIRRGEGDGRRRYDIVAEHFGLKATQAYQYYKLAQLEPFWLDMLDNGGLTIKGAVHLCTLQPEQREYLKAHIPLTTKDIFAINKKMTFPQMEVALEVQKAHMRELRMMVPADKYVAALEAVQKIIKFTG